MIRLTQFFLFVFFFSLDVSIKAEESSEPVEKEKQEEVVEENRRRLEEDQTRRVAREAALARLG